MFFPAFQRLLIDRRVRYAFVLGAVMWSAWLISLLFGSGNRDVAGHPIGADYVQFYAAGYAARTGQTAELYDFMIQWQLQRDLVIPDQQALYAFITPPHFAWLFVPFSALPYGLSFALWAILSLCMLWVSLRLLGARTNRPMMWALTSYVVFASVSYGQNGLLSLFILSMTYWLWRRGQSFWAGLTLALLMYKPQLAIGVGILWLLQWRRDYRALLGLVVGSAATAALSLVLLPAASRSYVSFARTVLPDLASYPEFPLWNQHSVRGFWQLLLPHVPWASDPLTLLVALGALAGFAIFWRHHHRNDRLMYSAAVCLTVLLTPHLMIYDLALLLIPALLLWTELPTWRADLRAIFGLLWLTTLLSPLVSLLQQRVMPVALQISVPVMLYCTIWLWRMLQTPSAADSRTVLQHWPLSGGGVP